MHKTYPAVFSDEDLAKRVELAALNDAIGRVNDLGVGVLNQDELTAAEGAAAGGGYWVGLDKRGIMLLCSLGLLLPNRSGRIYTMVQRAISITHTNTASLVRPTRMGNRPDRQGQPRNQKGDPDENRTPEPVYSVAGRRAMSATIRIVRRDVL